MKPSLDEVRAWLAKGRSDLLSARHLMRHDPPLLDSACFHGQQAAEKVLKAFLVWKSAPFEKVHSLTYLLGLCRSQEARFQELQDRAEMLTPYAVVSRYPGDAPTPSREDAAEVLRAAETLWDFVLAFLPPEVQP